MDRRDMPTYQIVDNLTWIHGTHTLKFGWEGRDIYSNSITDFGARTLATFAPEYELGFGTLTGDLPDGILSDPILNDEVAMLLGFVSTQSQTQFFDSKSVRNGDDLRGFRQREIGVFAQDSWKFRPNLTLNYGLRWEYYGVPFEAHNNFSNLFADPSGLAPFTFTIVGPGSRPAWANEYQNFEPRVGFAWDPFKTGKTSVRAPMASSTIAPTATCSKTPEPIRPSRRFLAKIPRARFTGFPAAPTVPTTATAINFSDGGDVSASPTC